MERIYENYLSKFISVEGTGLIRLQAAISSKIMVLWPTILACHILHLNINEL